MSASTGMSQGPPASPRPRSAWTSTTDDAPVRVAAVGFPQVVNLGLVAALAPCADLELLAVSTTVGALLSQSLAIDVVVLDPTVMTAPASA